MYQLLVLRVDVLLHQEAQRHALGLHCKHYINVTVTVTVLFFNESIVVIVIRKVT